MAPESGKALSYLRTFVERPPRPIVFEKGLSQAEIDRVEQRFGFTFPSDLRALLSLALPVSEGFPNWRSDRAEELQRRLDWPADGLCFDIEHNGFWYERWGSRPTDLGAACALARSHVAAAPKLVPVYSHRFIVAEPARAGNPVLSVMQADIIYYGQDLEDYLAHEFDGRRVRGPRRGPTRSVPFWDDIIMGRHRGGL